MEWTHKRDTERNVLCARNERNSMSWMTNNDEAAYAFAISSSRFKQSSWNWKRRDPPSRLSLPRPALEWRKRAREGLKEQELGLSFRLRGRRRGRQEPLCLRRASALTLSSRGVSSGWRRKVRRNRCRASVIRVVLPCPLTFRGGVRTEAERESTGIAGWKAGREKRRTGRDRWCNPLSTNPSERCRKSEADSEN